MFRFSKTIQKLGILYLIIFLAHYRCELEHVKQACPEICCNWTIACTLWSVSFDFITPMRRWYFMQSDDKQLRFTFKKICPNCMIYLHTEWTRSVQEKIITTVDSRYYELWNTDILLISMLFQDPSQSQIDSIYDGYFECLDISVLFSHPNSIVITRAYCIQALAAMQIQQTIIITNSNIT